MDELLFLGMFMNFSDVLQFENDSSQFFMKFRKISFGDHYDGAWLACADD